MTTKAVMSRVPAFVLRKSIARTHQSGVLSNFSMELQRRRYTTTDANYSSGKDLCYSLFVVYMLNLSHRCECSSHTKCNSDDDDDNNNHQNSNVQTNGFRLWDCGSRRRRRRWWWWLYGRYVCGSSRYISSCRKGMGWTDPWWSIARTDTLWRLGTQRTVFGFLMFSGNIECIHPHELEYDSAHNTKCSKHHKRVVFVLNCRRNV